MPSVNNLISFLRYVESHRLGGAPLKFYREVLWRPIFPLENTPPTDLNHFRWVHDHLNESWFAL
jgi:hypothetical protein